MATRYDKGFCKTAGLLAKNVRALRLARGDAGGNPAMEANADFSRESPNRLAGREFIVLGATRAWTTFCSLHSGSFGVPFTAA
jgi:hypothetical protein